MNQLEKLKQENRNLEISIDRADRSGDIDNLLAYKRKYYNNKIAMLDLVNKKNEGHTISARELRTKVNNMPKAIRYETGVSVLDAELKGGFEIGSLVQLAGQSGGGKTTLFLQIVANIAKYSKAAFFNFELGDRRIIKRLTHLLNEEQQWDNLMINSETRDIEDLAMEITLMANDGVKFFAVDSRLKLNIKSSEAEHQKISQMSSILSACAIRNDVIILLINQISEEDLKTGRLSFKGSGNQMFETDLALFIVIEEDESRKLICSKNRQDDHLFNITLPKTYSFGFKETVTVYEDIQKNDEDINISMSVL